ncbi:hypothetical protein [Streptomyces mirabilis]|uniref:Uncharacterized protein n=1 Tax=Streptomyces mirabilis TaxID=68239 RepID=A0ABU3V729_9ACTN|nr:hypothetical protein [Streptomyces mirabilis]MCX5357052.1 hypothetical protein [Streptomyces mirabilis]MDU9001589.1 hypothetical protein [Streptomyces mirabilis]
MRPGDPRDQLVRPASRVRGVDAGYQQQVGALVGSIEGRDDVSRCKVDRAGVGAALLSADLLLSAAWLDRDE